MFTKLLSGFQGYDFILASGSPRRKELLTMIGADFKVISSDFPETLDKASFPTPEAYCKENAKQKALDVYNKVKQKSDRPLIVIGSDTIVVRDKKILEKPGSKEEAIEMLSLLQGRSHEVISSIALVISSTNQAPQDYKIKVDSSQTKVHFDQISAEEIEIYVNTNDSMDKAGGYGIQGPSALFIREITGDYYTVVSLVCY